MADSNNILTFAHRNLVTKKYSSMNDIESTKGEIVMYQPDETIRLEVRMEGETVWLTQQQMAELFQKDQSVVARHINNAFKEGELEENSNMHFLHNTQYKYRPTKVYSLDVIISVGYRVKSKRGTAFRQWANKVLKEYLLRGYAINPNYKEIQTQLGAQDKRIGSIVTYD